jgi:rare lipoprotein A
MSVATEGMTMIDPRSLLLPFAAIAIATGIAALDQTAASLFPASLPTGSYDFDSEMGLRDPLARELSRAEREEGSPDADGFEEIGQASWYGRWHHGRQTASGEKFDMNKLTAAHRSLPLGTNVRVTNLENGRSIDVTINDRGPYVGARVIDLSRKAARELRMEKEGLAPVLIEELPKQNAAVSVEARAGSAN